MATRMFIALRRVRKVAPPASGTAMMKKTIISPRKAQAQSRLAIRMKRLSGASRGPAGTALLSVTGAPVVE
jgi:hypothetical protein